MAQVAELLRDDRLKHSRFLVSDEYRALEEQVKDLKDILDLKESKGWKVLTRRIEENLEALKIDMLFADEPVNMLQARIEREHRKAFAKALVLITDHVEAIVAEGKEALDMLEGRVTLPEYPGE